MGPGWWKVTHTSIRQAEDSGSLAAGRVEAEDCSSGHPEDPVPREVSTAPTSRSRHSATAPTWLIAWPFISHLELFWDDPGCGSVAAVPARFARVIEMDQRGMGLSDA